MSDPSAPAEPRRVIHVGRDERGAPCCPHCGTRNNAHLERLGDQDARPPAAGDFSVCTQCRGVAVYTPLLDRLALRKPTVEERAAFLEAYPAAAAGELDEARAALAEAGIRDPQEGQTP